MTQTMVLPGGVFKVTYNAGTDDSDWTYTVPTGKAWLLLYAKFDITASANAGNRHQAIDIGNGTNVFLTIYNDNNAVAATQRGTIEIGFGETYTVTANQLSTLSHLSVTSGIRSPIPLLYLPAGYTIRLWDISAIHAAGDDCPHAIHYIEYDA